MQSKDDALPARPGATSAVPGPVVGSGASPDPLPSGTPAPAPVFIVSHPAEQQPITDAVHSFELEQARLADAAKTAADQRAEEAKAEPVSEAQAKERGIDWPLKGRRAEAVPQETLDRIALLKAIPEPTPAQKLELARLEASTVEPPRP